MKIQPKCYHPETMTCSLVTKVENYIYLYTDIYI